MLEVFYSIKPIIRWNYRIRKIQYFHLFEKKNTLLKGFLQKPMYAL